MSVSLNLTRDQLATFLKNHEQIRQFERLFEAVDEIAPDVVQAASIAAGNAQASANEALASIERSAQAAFINSGTADQKATQALNALERIASALEMIAAAPAVQNNNSTSTDYLDLNERAPVPANKPGRAYWNRDDGTMDVDLYGGSVLQVGQEIVYYAKNTSGGTITNGTPVMFTGTVGSSGKLTFGKAIANGTVLADYMMGVATQDIANNAFGYITSFGLVRGFNTTGSPYGEVWSDGDLLYFDPATPGTWTNVAPQAPNIDVPVAVVIDAGSGGSGSIFVRMTIAESLSRLQDVYINGTGTPANGDMLVYVNTNKRWENKNPTATRDSLGLGTGTPANGRLLIGNGTDFTTAALTAGSNISVTNGPGSIVIAVTGLGSMAFQSVGATGSFTAASGETVTVVNGIITSII